MLKEKSVSVNQFILGLFFLLWATNAYILFGNIGKYLSLVLGLFFLIKSILVNRLEISTLVLIAKSSIFFVVFVFIAKEQNQLTFNLLTLVFGLICLGLLVLGSVFRKTTFRDGNKINTKITMLISVLIIVSNLKLYLSQALIVNEGRGLGDENLNPVGVAYVQAQLFLIIFWMFTREKSQYNKILLLTTLISLMMSLVLTGSRGALIFMVFTLLIFYRHLFRSFFKIKPILLLILSIMMLMFVLKDNIFFNNKVDSLINRFTGAIIYVDGGVGDRSLESRAEMQEVFFEKYDKMFYGYSGYKPYPHNQFIEIYMRWGFFGIPLFFLLIFSFIKSLKYTKFGNKLSLYYLIVSLFFFCFMQSMTSLSLEMNRLMWFGFGFLITNSSKLQN